MNKKLKKILIISGWILIICLVSFLIYTAQNRQKNLICKRLLINQDSIKTFSFVNKIQIFNLIRDSIGTIEGKPMKAINIQKIEKTLALIPYLKNITVYKTLQGEIKIDLSERKPIAHVFTKNNETFYIDDEGILIPTSPIYTSNVLAVTGEIYEPYSKLMDLKNPASINNYPKLYKSYIISQYISKDEFWSAMIDQINLNRRGELELIPKMGKHRIIMGNIDNLDKKFYNLMVFYEKVLNKIGWDTYEAINLKFNDQVVCTIKNKL